MISITKFNSKSIPVILPQQSQRPKLDYNSMVHIASMFILHTNWKHYPIMELQSPPSPHRPYSDRKQATKIYISFEFNWKDELKPLR